MESAQGRDLASIFGDIGHCEIFSEIKKPLAAAGVGYENVHFYPYYSFHILHQKFVLAQQEERQGQTENGLNAICQETIHDATWQLNRQRSGELEMKKDSL